MKENLDCPKCGKPAKNGTGWRMHMSQSHGGYTKDELATAGLEETAHDRIKFMSGFRSLEEVQAAAPATEGEGGPPSGQSGSRVAQRTRGPRLTKDEQEKLAQEEEFKRLKPMLVTKWRRRLRMVYGVWARLADDPKIKLSDEEAEEGSEMHVELMQAFGWIHAGKIEAVADLLMWHGAMILSRSELGSQLLASFQPPPDDKEHDPGPTRWPQ